MTFTEYKAARKQLGTQPHVAALLGIHRVTIAKREANTLEISREAVIAIKSLMKPNQISAVTLENEFDNGKDVTGHFDLKKARVIQEPKHYPENEEEAIAYAEAMTLHVGVKHIPIELAPGNPFGVKYAAVTENEAPDYTERGCFALPKLPPE